MAATVAVAAARLTSLGLLVTRSPCPRTRPKRWAYPSVILRRTSMQADNPVTIQERDPA